MAEIKNYFLNSMDRIIIIPILELDTCKHHLCSMCIRKIRKKKKLPCPICRDENLYCNLYSINRNVVDVIKCNVVNIYHWNKTETNIDAASLANVLFEKSLFDDGDNNKTEDSNDDTISTSEAILKCVKAEIAEKTKFNIKQKLICEKLKETNSTLQKKIDKIKIEYDDLYRKVNGLHVKRITMEKSLKALNDEHAKIVIKNAKLINQNKMLSNKNVDLIKHKNLLQNEYTTLKQKTYTCVTNSTITTNVTIDLV